MPRPRRALAALLTLAACLLGAGSALAAPAEGSLRLTVALEPRDPAALERLALAVSDPDSPHYRDYLSVAQFAARFGATRAEVAAVRAALTARGFEVGAPGANRLSLPVTAAPGTVEDAFDLDLHRTESEDGETVLRSAEAPRLPAAVEPLIQGVYGLEPGGERRRHGAAEPTPFGLAAPSTSPTPPQAEAGPATKAGPPLGPQPCKAITEFIAYEEGWGWAADQVAEAYSFTPFYAEGNFGAGQTVAVLEMEPTLPADIEAYQGCYGTSASVTYVDVNGGPGPWKKGDDGESSLDIEQVIGLAPEADILVYQAPNEGDGETAILERWVNEKRAEVMSSSWGICEQETSAKARERTETLLQQAAVQGQTFVVASGDTGSEDCFEVIKEEGQEVEVGKELAVDYPGSSPFATDVGGTRLESVTDPGAEYIWNDAVKGKRGGGGGGGGISSVHPMPSYQSQMPEELNLISSYSSGLPCKAASGYCRQVPDVSANADPATGYVMHSEQEWQLSGGTSAAAPLWGALIALTNAKPSCRGETVGFANPALYKAAANGESGHEYDEVFNDIESAKAGAAATNDVVFAGEKPYPPEIGFDMASGLGTPVASKLAESLCLIAGHHYTVAVTAPGDQLSLPGKAVSLPIRAIDSGGAPLSFRAAGLPSGLTIDAATGLISGVPKLPGPNFVTVTARDRYGNSGTASFKWTISVGPAKRSLGAVRISGLAGGRPRLVVNAAATEGETLETVVVVLPTGLLPADAAADLRRGSAGRDERGRRLGARLDSPGRKVRFRFERDAAAARLVLRSPALEVTDSLQRRAKRHELDRLRLSVTVGDSAGRTRLSYKRGG